MERVKEILFYHADSPLLFTQLYVWVFFAIVLTVYSLTYKKTFFRSLFLFISSLFFYWKTGGFFFLLLLLTTVEENFIGRMIYNNSFRSRKKKLVAVSLVLNLGIHAYFEYAYFIA